MILEKLYAKASTGKIKWWQIEARGDTMIAKHGYVDSDGVNVSEKLIKPKNVGRANATTAEEQCVLECESKFRKKVDAEYVTSIEATEDAKSVILPMLAHPYNKRGKDIVYPCYVQPKLDGVRCIYQDGKFMSRKGKEYTTLNHLVKELEELGIYLPDGEIYTHGMSFQNIVRKVKKMRDTTNELEYWIYDYVNESNGYEFRHKVLTKIFSKFKGIKIKFVETTLINNEANMKAKHNEYVADGYEGIIIRNFTGGYNPKNRSVNLQKYKEFIDEEFMIAGGHESDGEPGCVVFDIANHYGPNFKVRPKGTQEMRGKYLDEINSLIGKQLTIRYQSLSEDGVPIFPVGIVIRDYE